MRGRRIFREPVDPYLAPAWQDPPEPPEDKMASADKTDKERIEEAGAVYMCCIVAPDPKAFGCPVCGCMDSYRTLPKPASSEKEH